jgi:hypothetical protein
MNDDDVVQELFLKVVASAKYKDILKSVESEIVNRVRVMMVGGYDAVTVSVVVEFV